MAKKKVTAIVKIQIPAGKATPAPPVGTALGPHGVAIMDFVKQYNAATEAQAGTIIPVEITIFEDRTFSFVLNAAVVIGELLFPKFTVPGPAVCDHTVVIGTDGAAWVDLQRGACWLRRRDWPSNSFTSDATSRILFKSLWFTS